MNDTSNEAIRERLQAAIWYTVGEICESQAPQLNVTVTPQLIASLSEIVFRQAENFAKHAKRSTVSMDDIKLVSRRNESLHELISAEADRIGERHKAEKELKRKKR
ncbi:hypothetical protein DFQ27_002985 [Actinomortierella ambigua]|uniref:Centromere protein S n=1 Tax=Actinomortierella ambigua TaxID=1343610 RepID=A0A9P6Q649_9FUNG|nr:hypothetical protein DFQ27_002985 [Actinomortierella ambigua]